MSYKVKTITVFERQAKRLIKKYASLKKEIFELVQELKENPKLGTAIGKDCYNIDLMHNLKELSSNYIFQQLN